VTEQELHILLVDDDEDDAVIIEDLLKDIQRIKLIFHWVPTYEEGVQILDQSDWSAVLVDYDLGRKNGLDFIREANDKQIRAPLIMVTGRGRYEIDVEAMQVGAADYISKEELNSPFLERTIRYAIDRRRVEEDLERRIWERTQELQLLLDQTPAILWSTNQDLQITSVRGKGLTSLKCTPEDVLGKPLPVAFPNITPDEVKRMMDAHQRALLGEFTKYEIEICDICLSAYVQPFVDQEHKLLGCIGTAFDVSEQKKAEEAQKTSLALFEGLFEASPDAILLVLSDGMIQRANHQVEAVFGYARDELVGQPIERLIPARFRDIHVQHRSEYNQNLHSRPMGIGLSLFGLNKDRHEFPVDVTLSPLSVNQQNYIICVVRDMSGR
jgi:PAS domain S-box-containing protein